MSKKIYDVVPPKVARKVEITLKSLDTKNTKKKRSSKTVKYTKKEIIPPVVKPSVKPKRKFPLREVVLGGLVIVLLVGIYFYNKLPKVTVEILPSFDALTLDEKITADKSAEEIDFAKKIIPLEFFEEEKESSQEFPATGITSNDGKSTGTIKVYNKASPATPITLIAGTHFLSDSGKYFVTLSKITVPSMQGKTPGSASVKVEAKEIGSESNIKPSKFSVPKLSGTNYYYSTWGESTEPMVGGYTGKVKKVSKDDLESAKDVLTQKLLEDAVSSISNNVTDGKILLKEAISSKVISVTSDTKADTVVDKFNITAKVKVSALVFKTQDLEAFAKQSLVSKLTEGNNLLEISLNLDYGSSSVDLSKGIEKINLKASASSYPKIDPNDLPDLLKRKSLNEIKDIISLKYGEKVSLVRVTFWPFWVKKAPKDINRIKVDLRFE